MTTEGDVKLFKYVGRVIDELYIFISRFLHPEREHAFLLFIAVAWDRRKQKLSVTEQRSARAYAVPALE